MSRRLRRATDDDAAALLDIHARALRAAGTDPSDVPDRRDLEAVETAFFSEGGEFLVLEEAGTLLAMGGYRPVDEATVELFRIAVAPGSQREGFGERIVGTLERRARVHGYERVALETVTSQEAAMRFYRARGYTETGRRGSASGNYTVVAFEKAL